MALHPPSSSLYSAEMDCDMQCLPGSDKPLTSRVFREVRSVNVWAEKTINWLAERVSAAQHVQLYVTLRIHMIQMSFWNQCSIVAAGDVVFDYSKSCIVSSVEPF